MNRPLILCLLLFPGILGRSQTYCTTSLTTTTTVRDALLICKSVAEAGTFSYPPFDGTDYYRGLDSFYLHEQDFNDTTTMLVSACPYQGKTMVTLKLWYRGPVISSPRELRSYTRRISRKLENPVAGTISFQKGQMPPGNFSQANEDPESDWSTYPINHATAYSAGIFETPALFKRNIADSINLTLTWRKDSVYILRPADSLSVDEIRLHETLKENKKRLTKWSVDHNRGILCYEGKLYFIIKYPRCLPLEKSNDSFYFHIPKSFPNLKSLNRVQQMELQASTNNYGNAGSGNVAGQLLGPLLAAIVYESINYAVEQIVLKKGKHARTMRECYVDLNTFEAMCL